MEIENDYVDDLCVDTDRCLSRSPYLYEAKATYLDLPYNIYVVFLGLLLSRSTVQAEEICIDGKCYEYTHEMTEDAIRDVNEFKYFMAKRVEKRSAG